MNVTADSALGECSSLRIQVSHNAGNVHPKLLVHTSGKSKRKRAVDIYVTVTWQS